MDFGMYTIIKLQIINFEGSQLFKKNCDLHLINKINFGYLVDRY